tara:strand:+ start:101 stop:295 length:195 start_codon:yes stop_codon:yes gene_type:complete
MIVGSFTPALACATEKQPIKAEYTAGGYDVIEFVSKTDPSKLCIVFDVGSSEQQMQCVERYRVR